MKGKKCPVCHGYGVRLEAPGTPREKPVPCRRCNSSGRLPSS